MCAENIVLPSVNHLITFLPAKIHNKLSSILSSVPAYKLMFLRTVRLPSKSSPALRGAWRCSSRRWRISLRSCRLGCGWIVCRLEAARDDHRPMVQRTHPTAGASPSHPLLHRCQQSVAGIRILLRAGRSDFQLPGAAAWKYSLPSTSASREASDGLPRISLLPTGVCGVIHGIPGIAGTQATISFPTSSNSAAALSPASSVPRSPV